MQGLCCSAGSGAGDQEPEQKSRACQRSPVSSPLPRLSPSVPGPETHRSPSGKRWKRPAQDRQAGSQPRTVDLHFKGGMGFNLHMVSSRQWLNTSPLCLLAHPDRHGVILVVNKDSLLFDGGGGWPGSHQQRSCFCCRQCWLPGGCWGGLPPPGFSDHAS